VIINYTIIRFSALVKPIQIVFFYNDKDFTNHMKVSNSLNVKTKFTSPYTNQDKYTGKNRKEQIRRFFPKKD
jgi:IS30 family transposase